MTNVNLQILTAVLEHAERHVTPEVINRIKRSMARGEVLDILSSLDVPGGLGERFDFFQPFK